MPHFHRPRIQTSKFRIFFIVFFFHFFNSEGAWAQGPQAAPPELKKMREKINEKSSKLRSLDSRFVEWGILFLRVLAGRAYLTPTRDNIKIGAILAILGCLKICIGCLQGLEGRPESSQMPIWRSCEFLSITIKFVSKN